MLKYICNVDFEGRGDPCAIRLCNCTSRGGNKNWNLFVQFDNKSKLSTYSIIFTYQKNKSKLSKLRLSGIGMKRMLGCFVTWDVEMHAW